MFLLIRDGLIGPLIKDSYYKISLELPKEFISKLYKFHMEFKKAPYMELKYEHYKIASYFGGDFAHRSGYESILGVIFEEEETHYNLELFLKRNLNNALMPRGNQTIKEIYNDKLLKYLALNRFFEKFTVQNVSEILILKGKENYQSCLLNIGEKRISNLEMSSIYNKILDSQQVPKLIYKKLNMDGGENVFLVFQTKKPSKIFAIILSTLTSYLENFLDYALEVMALFLLTKILKVIPLKPQLYKKYPDDQSLLEILHKSSDYQKEFNSILFSIENDEIYISPIIT